MALIKDVKPGLGSYSGLPGHSLLRFPFLWCSFYYSETQFTMWMDMIPRKSTLDKPSCLLCQRELTPAENNLLLWFMNLFLKRPTLKGSYFLVKVGSKFFPLRLVPFDKGDKTFQVRVISLGDLYIHLKIRSLLRRSAVVIVYICILCCVEGLNHAVCQILLHWKHRQVLKMTTMAGNI